MEQRAPLDFPFPNEIIEIVTAYLTTEDLIALAAVVTKRLNKCILRVLRKKLRELPNLLWKMSIEGDLEKMKRIFACFNKENISMEEMGVTNNEVNQGKRPTLVDINIDTKGKTALIVAAKYGRHHMCDYLITKERASLEARDYIQQTALIRAAKSSKLEVIKVLLQYNANVKAKDKHGRHATYWAAYHGDLDVLKMLVKKDRDVIDLRGNNGKTPLIVASICGRADICEYLVKEKNANVDLMDKWGKTALQYTYNPDIIKIIKKGVK